MSNVQLIIEERAADIGNFMVGRLLPFRQKRAVGPFVFIDHLGPSDMSSNDNLDIGPHPHIGLSTLTYLFSGAIHHRDSIDSDIIIEPGAVNWMTAGRGVVHSERTPQYLRGNDKHIHGLQIWVALPKSLEDIPPTFTHVEEKVIPQWNEQNAEFKLIAGEAFGRKSPVPVYSPLYFIEIKNRSETSIDIGKHLFGESALYILEGSIEADGFNYEPKHILIAKDSTLCSFKMAQNTTLYIFGGEPFEEKRHIFWNFVSSDMEKIERAKKAWQEQDLSMFPKIPSDKDNFVPLP